MGTRWFAALLLLGAVGCGSSSDSFSCQNTASNACLTVTVSGGTFTTKDCGQVATLVSSCPTTGIIGRCAVNNLGSVAGSCPSGTTCSATYYFYTGADPTASQTTCTALGGTWTAG